ncbi:MAG: iron-sulfur cluster assembly scaffold protein [Proteobacteria bacterium]|nr:iron-sulfur cluster assembly scaffold protein [Pseudomonadota bacterium]
MFLSVRNGKIEEARFATDGCIFTLAACTCATEMAKGKTSGECLRINQSLILNDLAGMPEDHKHCALLAAMTIQKALKNFAVNSRDPWKKCYTRG